MKKITALFLPVLIALMLLFSGCAFFPTTDTSSSSEQGTQIDTFELALDEKMVLDNTNPQSQFYLLTLYAGESYQIKTTIDDILGDDYYLTYKIDDKIKDELSVSDSGYIETKSTLDQGGIFVIDVDLYKNGSNKKVANKYFFVSLKTGEYAQISLTNENLTLDSNTSTYSFEMESGSLFDIKYSISSNTSYIVTFDLADPSYSSFMSVDSEGKISTTRLNENKTGEIIIKAIGKDGELDTVYLKIILKKSDNFTNELKAFDKSNAKEIKNGDTITLYKGAQLCLDVRYNNEATAGNLTVGSSATLAIDNDTATVTALNIGESELTISYDTEQIKITINVIKDKLLSIATENGTADLIIVNGTLHYINEVYATYESGAKREISSHTLITPVITDKNESHKTVTLTYTEDGESASVTYDVKFYVASAYNGQSTAYDVNDYLEKLYIGETHALPASGTVKLLVIPVWFNDSDKFFNDSQRAQIVEDIKYSMYGSRPSDELPSLKQYYEAQSYGAITMDITVSDFYSSPTSYELYSDSVEEKTSNSRILATSAISWYFENHTGKTLADYDLNNDGYLDGVIILYGANYYGAKSDENRSVAFASLNNDNSSYSFNSMAFCPIGDLYGLSRKEPTTQLTATDLSEVFSISFRQSSKTVIHEVGHMFGNDDLYEDQFSEERYSPAGGFVMQDSNYGGHDPYHINKIGWTRPQIYASSDYELGEKITLKLSDFQSSGQNIILTNKWNDANSLFDEYLILELFAPTGLNEYDSKISFANRVSSGVRLWHINSVLTNLSDSGSKTSKITDGDLYDLAYSTYHTDSEFDLVHMIRNNPSEPYNTTSKLYSGAKLFGAGDSFDMDTFKSQFVNGNKLDNGEKLGWEFTVEAIIENDDGTYDAIITLERTDNVRTEFTQTVALNRSDLEAPDAEEQYGDEIFGEDGEFSLIYKYVTPPSVYSQNYPISSNGMCLFAAADGNGGYIDLTIKEIAGKQVCINSISVTYSKLTNASLTVIAGDSVVDGNRLDTGSADTYTYEYEVNAPTVRIQNQYSEAINHWSVIALYEITISYTIK